MSLKIYLYSMALGTLLCWVAWFFVVTNLAPQEAGLLGLTFFYSSLFLALVGSSSVAGFLIHRARLKNDDVVLRHVRNTFRHSILISLFVVVALMLQSKEWISVWSVLGLLVVFFIIDSILTNRQPSRSDYV